VQITIDNITIGGNSPTFIIAEISANHNNDLKLAEKTIIAMKDSGADAVKVQTFLPEDMTLDMNTPMFMARKGTIWEGQKLFDLYKNASLPYEWHSHLKKVAEDLGMIFFSSPFGVHAVDMLEELNVLVYKVASPEITDIPLIKYIASTGKPIILSSGIASLADLELAINACRECGNNQIAILKCTTAYPAPFEEVNLKTIPNISETFKVIPGLSDHTLGVSIPIAAVALGAKVIEKHFTLDRKLGGVDSKFSIEPTEFKLMTKSIREVEKALGEVTYDLTPKTIQSRNAARSLFVIEDVKKDELLTEQNIRAIRPGYGLHPKYYDEVLGKYANKDITKGTPLKLGHIK
jgi:pseudaminic acid synthase